MKIIAFTALTLLFASCKKENILNKDEPAIYAQKNGKTWRGQSYATFSQDPSSSNLYINGNDGTLYLGFDLKKNGDNQYEFDKTSGYIGQIYSQEILSSGYILDKTYPNRALVTFIDKENKLLKGTFNLSFIAINNTKDRISFKNGQFVSKFK